MDMGMVNAVIPHAELEDTAYEWAQEILGKSPIKYQNLL
jgi:naphthoate synthase